jgi:hypothetical protein
MAGAAGHDETSRRTGRSLLLGSVVQGSCTGTKRWQERLLKG